MANTIPSTHSLGSVRTFEHENFEFVSVWPAKPVWFVSRSAGGFNIMNYNTYIAEDFKMNEKLLLIPHFV